MTDHPSRDDATRRICAGDRPRPYRRVHRELRALLLGLLCRAEDAAAAETARRTLGRQAQALLDLCEAHQRHETALAHTLLAPRAPRATLPFDDDHADQRDTIAALRGASDDLVDGLPSAQAAQYAFVLQWSRFVAEKLEHMADEETLLTRALWTHCSDAELEALERRLWSDLRQAMTPAQIQQLRAASTAASDARAADQDGR